MAVAGFVVLFLAFGASWLQTLIFLGLAYGIYGVVVLLGDRREAANVGNLLSRIGEPVPREAASHAHLKPTFMRIRRRTLTVWIGPHDNGIIVHRPFGFSFLIPSELLHGCPTLEGKGVAKWWIIYRCGQDQLRILDVAGILASKARRGSQPT